MPLRAASPLQVAHIDWHKQHHRKQLGIGDYLNKG